MKALLFAAAIAIVTGTVVVARNADAESAVDCSSLKNWSSDTVYKKGDVVWYRDGGMNSAGAEFKCDKEKCQGGADEPNLRKAWTYVGFCDKRPG